MTVTILSGVLIFFWIAGARMMFVLEQEAMPFAGKSPSNWGYLLWPVAATFSLISLSIDLWKDGCR